MRRLAVIARTSLNFSFPKAYFREGSRVPTFVLPGIIRGNIHIARRYEESFDIVKNRPEGYVR